jgi:hypothetical protein
MMHYQVESERCRFVAVPCPPDSHPLEAGVLSRYEDTLKHADRMPSGGKSINAPRDIPGVPQRDAEAISA